MANESDLVTVSEIVNEYGVARKTVQRWVADKRIVPAQTLPGRTGAHLFTRSAAAEAFGKWKKLTEPASADKS